jgi:hypothetical protein
MNFHPFPEKNNWDEPSAIVKLNLNLSVMNDEIDDRLNLSTKYLNHEWKSFYCMTTCIEFI